VHACCLPNTKEEPAHILGLLSVRATVVCFGRNYGMVVTHLGT
jgi:hypothetical protein